jgi:hypothetical protein
MQPTVPAKLRWPGTRTSEGELREDEEVEAVEVCRVQLGEDGVGARQVVDHIAHVRVELQASDPHGGDLGAVSVRATSVQLDKTKPQPRPLASGRTRSDTRDSLRSNNGHDVLRTRRGDSSGM